MSLGGFIVVAAILQVAMVIGGHYTPTILNLSAALGMGIPLVLGACFGACGAASTGRAALGGFLLGIIGAAIGILVAILMGDQQWALLAFGPVSSGVTGLVGAVLLYAFVGRRRQPSR